MLVWLILLGLLIFLIALSTFAQFSLHSAVRRTAMLCLETFAGHKATEAWFLIAILASTRITNFHLSDGGKHLNNFRVTTFATWVLLNPVAATPDTVVAALFNLLFSVSPRMALKCD